MPLGNALGALLGGVALALGGLAIAATRLRLERSRSLVAA